MHVLQNAGWNRQDNKIVVVDEKFSGSFPFKHLFGFIDDYKKKLLKYKQQLILNRLSTDFDALYVSGIAVAESLQKIKNYHSPSIQFYGKWPLLKSRTEKNYDC